jgi:hypothetical protein
VKCTLSDSRLGRFQGSCGLRPLSFFESLGSSDTETVRSSTDNGLLGRPSRIKPDTTPSLGLT